MVPPRALVEGAGAPEVELGAAVGGKADPLDQGIGRYAKGRVEGDARAAGIGLAGKALAAPDDAPADGRVAATLQEDPVACAVDEARVDDLDVVGETIPEQAVVGGLQPATGEGHRGRARGAADEAMVDADDGF
jgi:hypothetical protein